MLRDHDLKKLAGQVRAVDRECQQHHDNLGNFLQNFNSLLESYNLLKRDYEEEKEGREKYKKMARVQERNPFALVLVDGDGYLFNEDLIRNRSEGGITAARLLTNSVKELLHDRLGDQAVQCRVMIRIYANLLGLSKALARVGLSGNEARSFAGFASSFTRSQDLADYIDAGDKKEGADHKVREMFRLFADINQCKHIFFAGCHDTGYLSLLTPYCGMADRITLLKGASFHREFESLGLSICELPSVFMSTELGGRTSPVAAKPIVCKHFQKGICKYGKGCTKQHTMPEHELTKPYNDTQFPSTPSSVGQQKANLTSPLSTKDRSTILISVNKDGDRLDPPFPSPSNEAWLSYARRMKQHKLCNKYHLGGECGDLSCDFDHSDIDDTCLKVMRYIMRQYQCPQGSGCRSIKCYRGHVCQRENCKGRNACRFNQHAHMLDRSVEDWVEPIEHDVGTNTAGTDSSDDGLGLGLEHGFSNGLVARHGQGSFVVASR